MQTTKRQAMENDHSFVTVTLTECSCAVELEYKWLNAELVDRPLFVFLHEGLGSIAMWKSWPQELCNELGVRGLLYSRPGYGRSTPRPRARKLSSHFMVEQACDVLPALLTAVGIQPTQRRNMWLIGHSDGGSIALLYASAFPEGLAGAVVIAPHVFVEDISVTSIAAAKVAYETGGLRPKLARYHADVDSTFYGWNDIWLDPAFRRWNIVPELSNISCPILAVQAEDDQYGTLAQVRTVVEQVPSAHLVTLACGGHSPYFRFPALLNQEIRRFLSTDRVNKGILTTADVKSGAGSSN